MLFSNCIMQLLKLYSDLGISMLQTYGKEVSNLEQQMAAAKMDLKRVGLTLVFVEQKVETMS